MSWLHRMGNKAVSAMSRLGKKVTGGVRRIGKRVRHSLGDIAATTGSISAGLGAAGLASALTGIGAPIGGAMEMGALAAGGASALAEGANYLLN